jgi:hypothetical protein
MQNEFFVCDLIKHVLNNKKIHPMFGFHILFPMIMKMVICAMWSISLFLESELNVDYFFKIIKNSPYHN